MATPYERAFELKMTKADDIARRYRNTLRTLASERADLDRGVGGGRAA